MISKATIAFVCAVLSGLGFIVAFALTIAAHNSGGSENWAPLIAIVVGVWVAIAQVILAAIIFFCSKQLHPLKQRSLRWAAYLFLAGTLLAILSVYISVART
jgi:formate hydrogenlyase subunit 3/multisubunit Na+/H+ antiporter MnhD subunit